jgi:hypothetical protein
LRLFKRTSFMLEACRDVYKMAIPSRSGVHDRHA